MAPGAVEKKLISVADTVVAAADRSRDPTLAIPVRSLANINFNEKRELAALPGQIESLEVTAAGLRNRFAEGTVYREGAAAVKTLQDQLAQREAELAAAYARWEALETRDSASAASGER